MVRAGRYSSPMAHGRCSRTKSAAGPSRIQQRGVSPSPSPAVAGEAAVGGHVGGIIVPGRLLLSSKVIGMSRHCASLSFPGRATLAKGGRHPCCNLQPCVLFGNTKNGRHHCSYVFRRIAQGGVHQHAKGEWWKASLQPPSFSGECDRLEFSCVVATGHVSLHDRGLFGSIF